MELSSFSSLRNAAYVIHPRKVRAELLKTLQEDRDSMQADYRARNYYLRGGRLLWIDRNGVDQRADTLLAYLREMKAVGFSPNKFCVASITADLNRLRTLQFDKSQHSIHQVLGRLEYHLTKAFFRYATGQQFGFTNPYVLFNKLDVKEGDSLNVSYYRLFDIPMARPTKNYWKNLCKQTHPDSLTNFIHHIQPTNPLYQVFKNYLAQEGRSTNSVKTLCNLERTRWRLKDNPFAQDKYVMVNVPAMELLAIDHEQVMRMRVGVGTNTTKTPLLSSRIMRMDVNPQWVMPKSIIDKSVARHAGDSAYFENHRYFIRNRETGNRVDPRQVTSEMLRSGQYFVIQEGGKGNAMGRIVFRFKNNFAVYLHDTSSRGVFDQSNRGVSHGCVRVEKPFELAVFLLKDKDEELIEKMRYSMQADIHSHYQKKLTATSNLPNDTLQESKLINSVRVQPAVPLYITYYTLYPNEQHGMWEYQDIYGFDAVIYKQLKNYLR